MKRNAQGEFSAAFEKELKACGLPTNEESRELFQALAKGRVPKQLQNRNPAALFASGFLASIAETLRQSARKRKIEDEAELDRALEEVYGLRYKLRPGLAQALSTIKGLPAKTGPTPKLTDVEKQAACNIIDTLTANKMMTKYAIDQAAKQFKVSYRMMRRVWENRGVTKSA